MTPVERFLAACRRQPVDRPPVWIMRQAGRYQPSYRALRQRASFLDICRKPELSCEATMGAIDDLGVDAAILFSDILVLLEAMGMDVTFPKVAPSSRPRCGPQPTSSACAWPAPPTISTMSMTP